ncbi:MAG: CRISPR system precrRNA processing endoribonuclease RAMP protein Cas6 [Proteobacteria bacterium]|nr:CRISPR system precrRNA processing endoribonuclease RAMP protein Cas6 [Pseudomonadota bacterium]
MRIQYIKTNFVIEPIHELNLPYFKGSTFRGVFGNAFRKVVCTLKRMDCHECILKSSCIYAYVFETSPSGETAILNMHKYKSIPHPFVIEPPLHNGRIYRAGEEITFSLIIIGKAIDYLPYFIYTFDVCGEVGIGRGRGKFILKRVEQDNKILYDNKKKHILPPEKKFIEIKEVFDFSNNDVSSIELELLTPVRIKHERKLVSNIDFYILMKNIMLRLNLLNFFHCEGVEAGWDHRQILEKAKEVKVKESNLRWFDWQRYSSRQDTKMSLGGVIGKVIYYGNIKPFLPLLEAGELLHVGKNTSFGLGKYEIINRYG